MESLQAPGIGMGIVLGALLFFGNLLAIYSVRAARDGRLTPATMAGIRTNATRASMPAWEAAHRAAWPYTFILNGGAALAAIAVMVLGSTVAPFLTAAGVAVALTAAGAISQIVVGHRAAQRELNR